MALTKGDLKSIENLLEKKLDEKLDEKFVDHLTLLEKRLDKKMDIRFDEADEKLDEKLAKINDFVEFAEPAIKALLTLENLHPIGVHAHVS